MFRLFFAAWCCTIGINANAQNAITGVVTEESGEGLVGATIQLDRDNHFAVTDEDGRYEIADVATDTYEVRVQFLGFKEYVTKLEVNENVELNIQLQEDVRFTDEVVVYATRATEKSPTTFTNIGKVEIQKQNFGQDLPFVLNWTPSLVATSDAGAGVGYTGLRVRGSDATRVNVTINGIPLNDSESQGVFWVNIPDIATSTQSIQVQRGVGTSTNGAGAFGASINLNTNHRYDEPYADIINSYGSFNTHRHTVGFGTGLIDKKFTFDGRASLIKSEGFIDRAVSDLKSFYMAAGYYGKKTMVKAIVFGGSEVTYQSWYGVPESRLNNDVDAMLTTAAAEGWNQDQTDNLLNSNSRTFNTYTYKDQVDNYAQDHYQLHISHQFNPNLIANAALHYTYGRGFFEEYKLDQSLNDYGVPDAVVGAETIANTDLIRRRWLDNDFFGVTYSLSYDKGRYSGILGGAANRYIGDHFGEIIWAEVALTAPKDYRYYDNRGDKDDFNIFWKSNYKLTSQLNGFVDLQYRRIDYTASGIENDQEPVSVDEEFNFFNPKVGLTYEWPRRGQLYASYSIAQREPVRNDFIDAPTGTKPKPEKMQDLEIGWRLKKSNYFVNVNYYMMNYKDQLVLTGELNDVGSSIRTNVDQSYRTGVEVEGMMRFSRRLSWGLNFTLSENRIKNFTEVIYDYGLAFDEFNEVKNQLSDVDISFSPSLIAGSMLTYSPFPGFESTLLTKYVGDQFLDNTSNADRQIDAYFTNDLRLTYSFQPSFMKSVSMSLLINNLLDMEYESNGYTWGYIGGGETVRQNYYYPQAGRNFIAMLALKF
ncbi:MAG: TonB-dependent receptor [Cyclobacteriaceae bacterium]